MDPSVCEAELRAMVATVARLAVQGDGSWWVSVSSPMGGDDDLMTNVHS
jgi:hypothetical protein